MRSRFQTAHTPARYLDDSFNPVGLWNFDGTLNAVVGGNLSVEVGAARYGPGGPPDGQALYLESSRVGRGAHDAALNILSALTVQAVVFPTVLHSSESIIVSFSGSAADEANNANYQLSLIAGNRVRFVQEDGGDNNRILDTFVHVPVGQYSLIALRRAANGVDVNVCLNGFERSSTTLGAAPTGGGSSQLVVGGFPGGGLNFNGMVNGVKINDTELSDDQILREAARLPFLQRPR